MAAPSRLARLRERLVATVVHAAAPVPPAGTLGLNRVCRPDAWDDPDWLRVHEDLGLPTDERRYHRKGFEWAQCAFGLEKLGMLRPDALVVGVGAGHECVLYHFANRCRLVVATDLYRGSFVDSPGAEAAADFLTDPGAYAPFPYRASHLVALPCDGRRLPFRTGSVDAVYSLSSIEHFGGHEAAAEAMREMARVLRPGGVACVATELLLSEGDAEEVFTRASFDYYVVRASGLVPVEALDDRPPPHHLLEDPIRIPADRYRTPHLVLGHGILRWTSVVVFLRKPPRGEVLRWALSARFLGWVLRAAVGRGRGAAGGVSGGTGGRTSPIPEP